MAKHWHYLGDVNLEHGGAYFRESDWSDHVDCVQVTPCSDAGGPDNLFWVESGTIYLGNPEHVTSALESCGWGALPDWLNQAQALLGYMGMDCDAWDGRRIVQIGKAADPQDSWRGWDDETQPDKVLRGNASLRRYVRREYMGLSA